MRIEIDFGTGRDGFSFRRLFLILLPFVLVAVALWLWADPILATLSPFALAFVFAYLFNPIVVWIAGEKRKRYRMHRGFAISILFLSIGLVFLAVVAYVIPGIVRETAAFTSVVRREYFPALKDSIRPKVEEWFFPRNVVANGNFEIWEEDGTPESWEVSTRGTVEKVDLGVGGMVLQASQEGWIVWQELAGLIDSETYALRVESATEESPPGWSLLVSVEIGDGTQMVAYETPLGEHTIQEETVSIPQGTEMGILSIHSSTLSATTGLVLRSIRLVGPPILPYFSATYWVDWYERNQELFTLSSLSRVVTYGFRGAGVVAGGAGGIWSWLYGTAGGAVSFALYLTLLFVIIFYMLLDFAAFKRDCLELIPEPHQERFASIMSDIDVSIGGFIRGRLVVCFIIGLLVTISLLVLRVPFAILLGIASGFLNLIPYLGPALSLAPAVALTSLEFLDTGPDHTVQSVFIKMCLVVISFTLIQVLDGFIISPKILADSVNVSPLAVLGVLMLGGGIAGITGMVLAIPVYCVLKVLVGEYRKELAGRMESSPP